MEYLFTLGIILIVSKIFALLSSKVHMPPVVGAIIIGIILGPTVLGIVHQDEILKAISEIGVIILMFLAGLETDITEFKKNIKACIIVATAGVIVPFTMGVGMAYLFGNNLITSLVIGIVLTATSVSITVATLHGMKKLNTTVGSTILGAAIVDDIIGILILALLIGNVTSTNESIEITLVKIVTFFGVAILAGILANKFFKLLYEGKDKKKRIPIFALGFCLLLSFFAEEFGVADITGAYIAGLVFSNITHKEYISEKVETISFMFFAPVFFASIGLATTFTGFDQNMVLFTLALVAVALVSKIGGCYLGSRISGFNKNTSYKISIGMIARGEVALIMVTKTKEIGIIPESFFSAIVIMVIATTLVTPILLQIAYRKNEIKDALD